MGNSRKTLALLFGLGLLVFFSLACTDTTQSERAEPNVGVAASEPEPEPEVGVAASDPEPEPEPASDIAERTETVLLNAFAVDAGDGDLRSPSSFTELLFAEGMEDSLLGYISGSESVGSTAIFTVQLTQDDVTKEELERTAFTIHSLTGEQIEDLMRVEVKTADSRLRGVSNRRDVPILNR